ncbi:uncharacterized protein LOC130357620 [Hyla sarda]|uniref:uncharacterized protein LOC130357620 n=1 Tax=Hyla sarda TaxID=327740 RepID=UPI0024C214BC|nr:uncharacterized protein LOC130357620 [Hyla sarda]
MEPQEASSCTPRTRPAGGAKENVTASSQDGVRRSTRAHRHVGPPPPSPAGSCKASSKSSSGKRSSSRQRSGVKASTSGSSEPQQWGVKEPRESLETFGSRIQAKMAQYEQLGKQLRGLREDIKFATYQADTAAKGKKASFTAKVRALKKEVEEIVQLRADIVAGAGFFSEKILNEERFPKKGVSRGAEKESHQDESEEEMEGGEEGDVSEGDMDTGSACTTTVTPDPPLTLSADYINPAQVALPPSSEDDEDGSDCSDCSGSADGGLLRAIVMQESPTRLENFTFGDDLGPEEKGKRKKVKGKKRKKAQGVKFVFSSFQQPGSAEKSAQGAGSPNLPDPVSVVERGQHGGYSSAPKMAAGAIEEKGHHPVRGEGVQAPENGGSFSRSGGGPRVEVSGTSPGAAGHSPVRGGSVRAPDLGGSGGGPLCAVGTVSGAAGHSPVKGEVPCTSAAVGGAGVRPEGQLLPKSMTSCEGAVPSISEAEPVSAPQKTGNATLVLKPATLIHNAIDPASPACNIQSRPPGWVKVIGS